MRNVKLLLQYDGTEYVGWAPQPNGMSIAERLAAAIRETTGEWPRLQVAGRTDAGVHARGQVVSFITESWIPTERLPYALNSRLPPDIVVVGATQVPETFHARFSAKRKLYTYTIDNSPFPSPLLRRYAAYEPRALDLPLMQAAAELLEGRHDFAAFRSAGGAAKTSVRTLYRLSISEVAPGPAVGRLLRMEAEGDGFLYNMVRIIAGTLLEVGLGRRSVDQVAAALATGDRNLAGKTAPARGLCLEQVWYE